MSAIILIKEISSIDVSESSFLVTLLHGHFILEEPVIADRTPYYKIE